jgi:hypothetical protein
MPPQALSTLQTTLPYELGDTLFPAYLPGQIQLSAHNGTARQLPSFKSCSIISASY